jgi:hypothetical protein
VSLDRYILSESGEPVLCNDDMEWTVNFEVANRRVAETTVGNLWISTVFLGLDHNWHGGPPILWETMVFCNSDEDHPLHQWMNRCSGSREQAIAMHERCVTSVKEWCALDTFPRRLWRFLRRKTIDAIEFVTRRELWKLKSELRTLMGRVAKIFRVKDLGP